MCVHVKLVSIFFECRQSTGTDCANNPSYGTSYGVFIRRKINYFQINFRIELFYIMLKNYIHNFYSQCSSLWNGYILAVLILRRGLCPAVRQ